MSTISQFLKKAKILLTFIKGYLVTSISNLIKLIQKELSDLDPKKQCSIFFLPKNE